MTNKNSIKKIVMEKIEKDEVKMKPKWQFKAMVYGMKSAVIILLLAGAISLLMMAYLAQKYTPLELLDYGDVGREILLSDFPYLFLGGVLIACLGSGILYSKIGDHYKKTTKMVMLLVAGAIAVVSMGLFFLAKIGIKLV